MDRMDVDDASPNHRSSRDRSTDTHRTRRSHRSISRERKRREREKDHEERRRRRSRSREKFRDRDRDREKERRREKDGDRERERGHHSSRGGDRPPRGSGRGDREDDRDSRGHGGHRDRERGEREKEDRERRRKRVEDVEEEVYDRDRGQHDVRPKRKREEDGLGEDGLSVSVGILPPPPFPPRDRESPLYSRRERERERSPPPPPDRRYSDRPPYRAYRDPRDEFDDPPRYRRDRDRERERGPPPRVSRGLSDGEETPGFLRQTRSPPAFFKRPSPVYDVPPDYNPEEPKEDDSEARSVFVSQLAARLTARDLGYFFEDKLGEGTVMDSRIVTDRLSRRSKGIGYVEFRTIDHVEKALALSGTVVMGLPIMIQLTESERNRLHPGDGNLNLPPGVNAPHGSMQLYVGSLHFNLTESDIKQVFEPFGELEFVDLHRDPMTGRSKGYAFVQYKRAEDARMALEQMEGFELAGRTLRVNTVHEKGSVRYTQQDSLDESGGGNLNAASRQALMQKLARNENVLSLPEPITKPITPAMQSRSVLLKNMFDPEEEIERDWDKDLAEDVKGECQIKYGPVLAIKVEKETQGEIYVKFDSVDSAKKAVQSLNGRWFGGKQVSATFISDAIMHAHQ